MDVRQMKGMLEQYGQLKARIENSRRSIRRIRGQTFEGYIEEKTYRSPLGERRLKAAKPSSPTETLGMYGREQFEREHEAQLRAEEYRLQEKLALLWQMDSLIRQLDDRVRVFIQRRYVKGERVDAFCEQLGVSRVTAFRRVEDGIAQMAELYEQQYEAAA